jgi:hypothetical protein
MTGLDKDILDAFEVPAWSLGRREKVTSFQFDVVKRGESGSIGDRPPLAMPSTNLSERLC